MTLRTQAIFNAGPSVEYSPRLEGDVGYSGAIHVFPSLYVSLVGRRWMLDIADIPIRVGPFPRHVLFDPSLAHLGLPDVRVEPSTVDFGPVVRAMKATNPDFVFLASYPIDTVGIIRAANAATATKILMPAPPVRPS